MANVWDVHVAVVVEVETGVVEEVVVKLVPSMLDESDGNIADTKLLELMVSTTLHHVVPQVLLKLTE